MADVKAQIEKAVEKLQKDPKLLEKFQKDPAAAIKEIAGVDIPQEQLQPVIAAVKAKLGAGDAADLLGKLGKLL